MTLCVERLQKQGNSMLKTLVKCIAETAEDPAKEATKRKQDQHILLTWLLEKHITMPPVGEITLERMTDTRKPSKTLKPLKSKLPPRSYKNYFQYIFQYVMGRIV